MMGISLILACIGLSFAYHVQRQSQMLKERMDLKMKDLQLKLDEQTMSWLINVFTIFN